MARLRWKPIIEEAIRIVRSYSFRPTLRQLFYRLVSAKLIPNRESAYKTLSRLTAEGRRNGTFPALSDGTRDIMQARYYKDDEPEDLIQDLAWRYRQDRTEGQAKQVWLVVEKSTLADMAEMAARETGVRYVALRGFGSQTIMDEIGMSMRDDGRPAVVLYVGDHDPSGWDIERVLVDRIRDHFRDFVLERVAVTEAQRTSMGLIKGAPKPDDSRNAKFLARFGDLFQIEVEAILPDELIRLMQGAVEANTDMTLVESIKEDEAVVRTRLLGYIEEEEE